MTEPTKPREFLLQYRRPFDSKRVEGIIRSEDATKLPDDYQNYHHAIDYRAYTAIKEELKSFKELHVKRLAELKEQTDKNAELSRKLAKAVEQRNVLQMKYVLKGNHFQPVTKCNELIEQMDAELNGDK